MRMRDVVAVLAALVLLPALGPITLFMLGWYFNARSAERVYRPSSPIDCAR